MRPITRNTYKRPSSASLDLPWGDQDICPCGSRRIYAQCCRQPSGRPLIKIPSLLPAGTETNFSNPRCYLNFTGNCSQNISREHYISRTVLEMFPKLTSRGMPWELPGSEREIGIESFTSKILCERHNSALSPLDSIAGKAMRTLEAATTFVNRKSLSKRSGYYLLSGDGIELWGLKTILGLYHSKIARTSEGERLAGRFEYSQQLVSRAFGGAQIPAPLGVYAHAEVGAPYEDGIAFAPYTETTADRLAGMILKIANLSLSFIFSLPTDSFAQSNVRFHRPWAIDLQGPKRTARVILTWQHASATGTCLNFKLGRS